MPQRRRLASHTIMQLLISSWIQITCTHSANNDTCVGTSLYARFHTACKPEQRQESTARRGRVRKIALNSGPRHFLRVKEGTATFEMLPHSANEFQYRTDCRTRRELQLLVAECCRNSRSPERYTVACRTVGYRCRTKRNTATRCSFYRREVDFSTIILPLTDDFW